MATITYIVKIASGKFTIDDAVAPKLTFRDGDTYVFDQADSSNSGHILQFSATSNNSGSSEYTTGVTKTGTPGSAGAKTTIVTSGSTTDTLYYYSSGGGTHGSEFSNSGFKTSTNGNFLKPIIGGPNTAEKWGSMVNHTIDQIDQKTNDTVSAGSGGTFSGNVVFSGTVTMQSANNQGFAAGTKMLFNQTAAPTGWTKVTSSNDVALRVVSGTVGSGGSVAFETAFASQTVPVHTLTTAQMPAHTHQFSRNSDGGMLLQ